MIKKKEEEGLSRREALAELISTNSKLHIYEMMDDDEDSVLIHSNLKELDKVSRYILNLEEYKRYSEVHLFYTQLKLQRNIEYEKIRHIDNHSMFNAIILALNKGVFDVEKLTELERKVEIIK